MCQFKYEYAHLLNADDRKRVRDGVHEWLRSANGLHSNARISPWDYVAVADENGDIQVRGLVGGLVDAWYYATSKVLAKIAEDTAEHVA